AHGTFSFEARGLLPGKHTAVLSASDIEGQEAQPARAAIWVKPAMESWAGGALDVVRAEVAKGTFDDLGVTALWLSPVYRNPDGLFTGRDGHPYEAYHGYWPLDSRAVDP